MLTLDTLGDLVASFRLYAVCEPCQRTAPLDIEALIAKQGADYPIQSVRRRLYCPTCKIRTESLRIVYVGPNGRTSGFHYAR